MAQDDDEIVTLKNADGEDIDFIEIAGIALRGGFYAILQPVELLDGMDDDEALVFRVTRGRNGEDKFEIELDNDIIDDVFAEYNRLLDEQQGKNTGRQSSSSNRSFSGGKSSKGGKKSASSGKKKGGMHLEALALGFAFLVLAIVSLFVNWDPLISALLFIGTFGCLAWFGVPLLIRFLKNKRR